MQNLLETKGLAERLTEKLFPGDENQLKRNAILTKDASSAVDNSDNELGDGDRNVVAHQIIESKAVSLSRSIVTRQMQNMRTISKSTMQQQTLYVENTKPNIENQSKAIEKRSRESLQSQYANMEQPNLLAQSNVELTANEVNAAIASALKSLSERVNNYDNLSDQLTAMRQVRQLLQASPNFELNSLIMSGLVLLFVAFMLESSESLQYEATVSLLQIINLRPESIEQIVNYGAVESAVTLLKNAECSERLQLKVMSMLGNIFGHTVTQRDAAITSGALNALLTIWQKGVNNEAYADAIAWCLQNTCRHKECMPDIDIVKLIMPTLRQLLFVPRIQTVYKVLTTIWYLCLAGLDYCYLFANGDYIAILLKYLKCGIMKLQLQTLQILTAFTSQCDLLTQLALDANLLHYLLTVLKSKSPKLVQHTLLLLIEISSGTTAQLQLLLNCDIMPIILKAWSSGKFYAETLMIIRNFSVCANEEQINWLAEHNQFCLQLCTQLPKSDVNGATYLMETLQNILQKYKPNPNVIIDVVRANDGVQTLLELKSSENKETRLLAIDILLMFFVEEYLLNVGGSNEPVVA